MPKSIVLIILIVLCSAIQMEAVSIISWNIQDFGSTKNDEEISFIAQIVKSYDVVAIQEVVGKDPAGAKAVARLADELNRTGAKWEYVISDPTKSPSAHISERYAFLWKPSRVKMISRPRLLEEVATVVHREPYYAQFLQGSKIYDIFNFHSRPYNKDPEIEVSAILDIVLSNTDNHNWIIAGDFNLTESEPIWDRIYDHNYTSAISRQGTTLKRTCKEGEYFNHAIDNIYYKKDTNKRIGSGIVDFIQYCKNIETARNLSDHVPVWVEIE